MATPSEEPVPVFRLARHCLAATCIMVSHLTFHHDHDAKRTADLGP